MKPFTWSYSALTNFENCPKKAYHLNIAKDVKDADSSFAADGKIVHDAMKRRVVDGKPLPLNLRHFEKIGARFAAIPGDKHGEMRLALNRQFEPVDYFAPTVWVRVVVDLAIVQSGLVIQADWKTGKRKDDPTQMALNTAVLAQWMPEIPRFKSMFVWLQSSQVTPYDYTRDSFAEVWNNLLPRVEKMEEARKTTTFPAKPNPLCGWCPVKSCPHWVSRE